MILNELVEFSNLYGSNEELVLAGGGNTSAKDGDIMYVKSSGTQLSTITADGFVKMDRAALDGIFDNSYPEDDAEREALVLADLNAAKLPGQGDKRPSVETMLHALFEQRFVLHLHPALVNGLTCAVNGESEAKRLFGESFIWIESAKPGYILAKLCSEKIAEYKSRTGKAADMLLLQNHGIFVAADTVEGLGEKLNFVLATLVGQITCEPDFSTGSFDGEKAERCFGVIRAIYGDDAVITYEPSVEALRFAQSSETAQPLMKPFTPDHIVYCKANPIYGHCDGCIRGAVNEYMDNNGCLPKIIIISGCGFFAVDSTATGSSTAANLFNDAIKIAVYSQSFGGELPMSDELSDFITGWEVEAYRSRQIK